MKKAILFILLAIVIWGIALVSVPFVSQTIKQKQLASVINTPTINTPFEDSKDTTLYFAGDIMLDRGVKASVDKNFGGDYSKLFDNLGEIKNADIFFANLEGPVSNKGNNVGSIYSFRMDPKVLPVLKEAGVDIVSFANNHVGDWNMAAFKDTLINLSNNEISETGAGMNKDEAEIPTIIEKNGTKFGFLAFSDVGPDWLTAEENTAGILVAKDLRLAEIIRNAKSKCDVLIVSFHFGVEYKSIHNARQESLAHTAIDNGADIVIGHHPHVMEDIEMYEGKPIVYSLGNFIFDQSWSIDTMHGMLFEATFTGKKLKETKQKIIQLNKFFQPEGIFEVGDDRIVENPKPSSYLCPKPKITDNFEDETYLDVGQNIPLLDKNYIPSDLVLIDKNISRSSLCLKEEAAKSLTKMINDAKIDKYNIIVSSAFRDYSTQKVLNQANIKATGNDPSLSVAKPGYSEHQLGVAVDLTSSSIAFASASGKFGDTKEAKWLADNAYKYGFIESYPKGKESITGYIYEPWHYRYVGIDNALATIKSDQTLNEFLEKLNDHKL